VGDGSDSASLDDFSTGILTEEGSLRVFGSGTPWVFDICWGGASDSFRSLSSEFPVNEALLVSKSAAVLVLV
jgi:hypothetical protein